MVEMQLAHEGSVGPDAAISPQGVDRARQRRRRVLWGAVGVVVVLALLLGAGGWLWWTRLPTTTPLPTGVEEGHTVSLGRSTPPPYTDDGKLEAGRMRKENHQWVGSLRWIRTNDDSVTYDVHLGETVYIDGLGAVTLLQVNPPPLFFDDQQSGGWDYKFNINLAPGTTLCWNEHSCIQ